MNAASGEQFFADVFVHEAEELRVDAPAFFVAEGADLVGFDKCWTRHGVELVCIRNVGREFFSG